MRTSSRMQPGSTERATFRKATPDGYASTAKPEVRSMNPADRRIASSSSTRWMVRLRLIFLLRTCLHQGKTEYCATGGSRLGPDPAAMRFDDRPADREAEAHALVLAADECLKELR